jgi:LuxR family maltose regulon positive regulatory protein
VRMESDVGGASTGAGGRVPPSERTARLRTAPSGLVRYVDAKMSRPRMGRAEVRRQRLIDQLNAGMQNPVTLVCAGAGWGKTVLVSAWAETTSARVRWLSLDSQDNDAPVFWSHVVAALRAEGGIPGDNPLAELSSIPADDVERIRLLERGLGSLPTPTVLVLDDFHEIDDSRIMRELVVLLRHPPRSLHLVLSTRTEPGLPLPRVRAAGELTEIRAADLAFTSGEITQLLTDHGLNLSSDDVTTLLDRTEGWAVGLRLAVAFLTGRDGPRVAEFAGDLRAVDDYLADEVLDRHPPDVRRFLLHTSLCEQVSGELADAITLGTQGQRILEQLEQANDFVVRLGAKPRWFRYHPLLRDVLRHRMLREDPTVVPQVHRRAAAWYAAHDSIFEALDHAVVARDWPDVGRLVVAHAAPQIVSAHRAALAQILERVPPEVLSSTAELMACAALRLFHAGDYEGIPEHLAGARELLNRRPEAERLPVEVTLQSLQVAVNRVRADMPALVVDSSQLLKMVARVRLDQQPSVLQHRAIGINNKGVGLLWTEQPDRADRHLWAAVTAARTAGMELPEINALGHLALLEVMWGSVREATHLAGNARGLAERRGWWSALQSVPAHLAQALVELERNDLAAAQSALQHALVGHRGDPEAAQWKLWLGARARLVLAQGDPSIAEVLLEEARRPTSPTVRTPALDGWLLLVESEVDLASGRPERVEQRYGRRAREQQLHYAEQVCLARAAFEQHEVRRAEDLLAKPHSRLFQTVARVEALILTALIADITGHPVRSADTLAAAVALAEQEGIHRPFISMGGGRLDALLNRQGQMTTENGIPVGDVVAEFRIQAGRRPSFPVGEFNDRETEVLRYLPTMLTAREIADYLNVPVNTVKALMRAIYRKLNATSRRGAVDRARERGLI